MEKYVLKLKDISKKEFLLQLLKQLDFIEFKVEQSPEKGTEEHDIFKSAGLFADRDIDAKTLRNEAWRIKE